MGGYFLAVGRVDRIHIWLAVARWGDSARDTGEGVMSERTSKMWKQMAEHIDEPGHTSAPPAAGVPSPSQTWPCTKCGGSHGQFEGCFEPATPAPAAPQCCMGYPRCIPGEAHNPECPACTAPCPHCPELCGASCGCDCHNPVPDIRRLLQEAKKEVDQWPQWMKDAPAAPQQGPGDGVPERQAVPEGAVADALAHSSYLTATPTLAAGGAEQFYDEQFGKAVNVDKQGLKAMFLFAEAYAASRVQVLEERLAKAEGAIRWALGYPSKEGEPFRARYIDEGEYWWRGELQRRAALTEDPNGG